MISAKKSIGISFAGQYLELVIHFLSVLVLARILSPEEIGVYSVAAFLMAVLHAFRDFGVPQYLIQERELTTEKIRAAMGVMIILALAVALVLFLSSWAIADFYGNPEIRKILWVMAGSFAISPFGSLLHGIFRREMELKKVFFIRIVSTVCHVSVAIGFAMKGFGALSLAWANFFGILSIGMAANLVRPKGLPWLPTFRNIRKILSYGSVASLGNAANTAGGNLPDLLVGKMMDMASVGYLSRANGLVQLFARFLTDALLPLILPYFSHLRRQGNDLAEHYCMSVSYLTAFAWPFFATMMLLAFPVVRTLYGPQWDASVPLVELLCLVGAIASVSMFSGQVMVANGQVRNATVAQLIVQPFRVVAVLFATRYGLLQVASALIVSECITLVVVSWYVWKAIGVSLPTLLRACAKSGAITLFTVAAPLMVKAFWPNLESHAWLPLAVGAIGAAAGWLTGIFMVRHPFAEHVAPLLRSIRLVTQSGSIRK